MEEKGRSQSPANEKGTFVKEEPEVEELGQLPLVDISRPSFDNETLAKESSKPATVPWHFAAAPDIPTIGIAEDEEGDDDVVLDSRLARDLDTLVEEEGDDDEDAGFSFVKDVSLQKSPLQKSPQHPPVRPSSPIPDEMPSRAPLFGATLAVPTATLTPSQKSLVENAVGAERKPPTATGRYRPIADDDSSLITLDNMKSYTGPGVKKIDKEKIKDELRAKQKGWSADQDKPSTSGELGRSSQGMASTANFLASLVKWKTRKQSTINKNEKYPGYLDVFNSLSKELMTSVPLPLVFQHRREAYSVVQNITKAYKSTLGPNHAMTKQAMAKLELLRSEIFDNDVFI